MVRLSVVTPRIMRLGMETILANLEYRTTGLHSDGEVWGSSESDHFHGYHSLPLPGVSPSVVSPFYSTYKPLSLNPFLVVSISCIPYPSTTGFGTADVWTLPRRRMCAWVFSVGSTSNRGKLVRARRETIEFNLSYIL